MNAAGALYDRFSGLSGREKVLLVACLLGVVAFAVARWVVMPVSEDNARNRAAIPARRAVIARYEAFRLGQERIDEELSNQVQRMEKWENGLLVGETTSAAGVFLQGLLKPLTQRPEIRVTSIRSLPPVKKGEYAEVAVQMEIQTSTEGLALLLADLSRQTKILRVLKLTASTGAYYTGQVPRKEVVAVSMVVAGLSAAPLDEKASGRGDE
jgi:hypothetical protein